MSEFVYDETDIVSIVKFAQRLENGTIDSTNIKFHTYAGKDQDVPQADGNGNPKNKGNFGLHLEKAYFGKINDNKSLPDFPKAGLELKASPLKQLSDYEIRVKERLVLNHFTYKAIDKEEFETSHFKEKNENILLVFYMYASCKNAGEMNVELADLWQCLKEDEAQIRADWQTIVNKVREGKAHEISEGDTLYLGACTKGANAASSMQSQPHSEIKAKGRALCFKTNYINHIFQTLLFRKKNRKKEERLLSGNERFEEKILNLYKPYMGKFVPEIYTMLKRNYSLKNKSRYASIARYIVGLNRSSDNFYEFNASGIQLKTVRVEPNGKISESISFKQIDYCEIVEENWEDSYLYSAMTSKFIFVIFKRNSEEEDYFLDKVLFWQIPEKDYPEFEKVWTDTKVKVKKGIYSDFIKIKENPIAHVRPHAKDSNDLMWTPQNTTEPKKSFWINQSYIQKNVIDPIYKR